MAHQSLFLLELEGSNDDSWNLHWFLCSGLSTLRSGYWSGVVFAVLALGVGSSYMGWFNLG